MRPVFPFYVAGIATGLFLLFVLSPYVFYESIVCRYGVSKPKSDSSSSETNSSEVKNTNDTMNHKTEDKESDAIEREPSNKMKRNPPDIGRFLNVILVFVFLWIVLTIVGQRRRLTSI